MQRASRGQGGLPLGLASSEGLGVTERAGESLRVPKATLTLLPKRDRVRATWVVTVFLPPLTLPDEG